MPKEESLFSFPIVQIAKPNPTLQRKTQIFASKFDTLFHRGPVIPTYENRGMDFYSLPGDQHYQAFLEITQGEIFYSAKQAPEAALKTQYLWSEMAYLFFPELVQIREKMDEAYGTQEKRLEEQFEAEANRIYAGWGLCGLGLDIYQDKPMLSTEFGILIINEYHFEEDIDEWEMNEEIWILPTQLYLRGLKPTDPPIKKKTKEDSIKKYNYFLLD